MMAGTATLSLLISTPLPDTPLADTPLPDTPLPDTPAEHNPLEETACEAVRRARQLAEDPEPSLARGFGQIGVLGWMIVVPVMVGVLLGGWLDAVLGTGITLSAALTMAGAAFGLWLTYKWMRDQ